MTTNIYIILLVTMLILTGCHPEKTEDSTVIYPKLLSRQSSLQYPADAFEKGIQGKTVVRMLVDTTGLVSEANILESSGSDILDEAALMMARSSVYEPGKIDGVLSAFWLHLPVQFTLGETQKISENINNWIELARIYQKQIESDTVSDQSGLYKNLYYHYQSLASEIANSRSISANTKILNFVDESIREPWMNYRDKWPLGFLLFQDYIKRYPENEFALNAGEDLIKSLRVEIEFLEQKSISSMPYSTIYLLISESLKRLYDQDLK